MVWLYFYLGGVFMLNLWIRFALVFCVVCASGTASFSDEGAESTSTWIEIFSAESSENIVALTPTLQDYTNASDSMKRMMSAQEEAATAILLERKGFGDPWAHSYFGAKLSLICMMSAPSDLAPHGVSSQGNCEKALNDLLVACDANIAHSCYLQGILYKNGWEVYGSDWLAADAFIKSAAIFIDAGQKNSAIRSLELAHELMPDHPKLSEISEFVFR